MKRIALTLLACVALTLLATTASAHGYSRNKARRPRSHYRTHRGSMYAAQPCCQGHGYTVRGPTDFFYSPSQHGHWGGGYRAYGH